MFKLIDKKIFAILSSKILFIRTKDIMKMTCIYLNWFQRPFSSLGPSTGWNKDAVDKKLLLWWFESQLKDKYSEFVQELRVGLLVVIENKNCKPFSTDDRCVTI